jgi:hypothetical protein
MGQKLFRQKREQGLYQKEILNNAEWLYTDNLLTFLKSSLNGRRTATCHQKKRLSVA